MAQLMWFRRDLRILDNPALLEAARLAQTDADPRLLAVVLIDPGLWPTWGAPKQAYLIDSLASLNASLNGNLMVVHGKAQEVIPELARRFNVSGVHSAADYSAYGIARDNQISDELAQSGISYTKTGSGYAVAPGRVTKDDGTFYKVYTPFYKNWLKHGWREPAAKFVPESIQWITFDDDGLPIDRSLKLKFQKLVNQPHCDGSPGSKSRLWPTMPTTAIDQILMEPQSSPLP